MSWMKGLGDGAGAFGRLYTAGSNAYSQDWLAVGTNVAAAPGKLTEWLANHIPVLKKALNESGTKVLPAPTAIIDATVLALNLIDFVNGLNTPDKGSALITGAEQFENVSLNLAGASPDPQGWEGKSAQAYADANVILQSLAETMRDLDREMQTLVEHQANAVKLAHDVIAYELLGLAAAKGIALALYAIPGVGATVSCSWQLTVAILVVTAVVGAEYSALNGSLANAGKASQLELAYGETAAKAQQLRGIAGDGFAPTANRSAGAVETTSSRSTAFESHSVARLAADARESLSPEHSELLSALVHGDVPGNDGVGSASVPGVEVLRLSAISEVSALPGQPANNAARASQQASSDNQTMAQVQQFASTGQHLRVASRTNSHAAVPIGLVAAPPNTAPADRAGYSGAVERNGLGATAGAVDRERAPVTNPPFVSRDEPTSRPRNVSCKPSERS